MCLRFIWQRCTKPPWLSPPPPFLTLCVQHVVFRVFCHCVCRTRGIPCHALLCVSPTRGTHYLSLCCLGVTGNWCFRLAVGLRVLICFEVGTYVLVLNVSPWYILWPGAKNQSYISLSVTVPRVIHTGEWTKNTSSTSRGEVVINGVFLSLQTSTIEQEVICSRLANPRWQTLTGTEGNLFHRLWNVVLVKNKNGALNKFLWLLFSCPSQCWVFF